MKSVIYLVYIIPMLLLIILFIYNKNRIISEFKNHKIRKISLILAILLIIGFPIFNLIALLLIIKSTITKLYLNNEHT